MSEHAPLTDREIELIAEKLVHKVRSQHHDFWIDPEQHYQDHIAMRDVVRTWTTAQSMFWRAFIGLAALGALVLAGIGMFGKVFGR